MKDSKTRLTREGAGGIMKEKKEGAGMRVLVAIDSFKGSLSSLRAGDAAREGILRAIPDAEVEVAALADGGEGTLDAILSAGGERIALDVTGPLGETVRAEYGILSGRGLAVIEMAAAAGLPLVPEAKRNPLDTTTYGVGELVADALARGCRRILLGIGGSATNDGGVGMLSALGYRFLDGEGREIPRGAIGLRSLREIDVRGALPALSECILEVASDVDNPLCGPRGCSAVFGPQKGATPESVSDMDAWLASYAMLTASVFGRNFESTPGAGAAGGMGFACLAYLGGTLRPGVGLVIEATGLRERIRRADLVITGEGRLDAQSAMGKAPVGVARLAKEYGKTVIALAGSVGDGADACIGAGIDAYFPILARPSSLAEAMDSETAARNLARTAEQVVRLLGR